MSGPLLGIQVDLHSLLGRSDLNGRRGVVKKALDSSTGRVGVHVDGEATLLALKLANLNWEERPVVSHQGAHAAPDTDRHARMAGLHDVGAARLSPRARRTPKAPPTWPPHHSLA